MSMTLSPASALPDTPCHLNGDFSTLRDAKVSALDRGFIFGDGILMGPPKDNRVLEGMRYGLMKEMCRALGLAFELRPISRAEVLAADELLLTSATKEILPITLLDGQPVGSGKPGNVFARVYAAYQQAKQEPST